MDEYHNESIVKKQMVKYGENRDSNYQYVVTEPEVTK